MPPNPAPRCQPGHAVANLAQDRARVFAQAGGSRDNRRSLAVEPHRTRDGFQVAEIRAFVFLNDVGGCNLRVG